MARLDPDDDSIERWIVRRHVYDPDRRERRHMVLAAFDNETEFNEHMLASWLELKAQKATGHAEPQEHITGTHLEAGYAARQRARRMQAKSFGRTSRPPGDGDLHRTRFTERLRLEPIGLQHAHALFVLHQDENVARWHAGAYTEGDAQRKAAEYATGWAGDGISKWIAYDRQTGELVGRGGLSYAEVDGERELEVGWTVRDTKVGRGYASEIGRAALSVAFGELGAHDVVSFTEVENERSRAVMERLGMHYIRDIIRNDEPFALYAMTTGEETRSNSRNPLER